MAVPTLQIPQLGAVSGGVDWQPLANLGKVYEQAQNKRNLQDALSGGVDPNNPQSLAQLAARVLPYDSTMGMSLAQLSTSAANRQQDIAWRQQEAERTQRNADRSYGLQERAAARADQGPVETAAQRAEAARSYGVDPTTPAGRAYILTGRLPEQDASFQVAVEQRKQAAIANGLDPSSPGYQSYILTGKMPREDAQPLTAGDKKAIMSAEDELPNIDATIGALRTAKDLNEKTFTGWSAPARAYIGSNVPGGSYVFDKTSADATTEWQKVMSGEAIKTMSDTLKGATTDFEMRKFTDMLADPTTPPQIRARVIDRMITLAERQRQIKSARIQELKGGTYYKPQASAGGQTSGQGNGADTMLQQAREAIQMGASRDAVISRLRSAGIDPGSL